MQTDGELTFSEISTQDNLHFNVRFFFDLPFLHTFHYSRRKFDISRQLIESPIENRANVIKFHLRFFFFFIFRFHLKVCFSLFDSWNWSDHRDFDSEIEMKTIYFYFEYSICVRTGLKFEPMKWILNKMKILRLIGFTVNVFDLRQKKS